MTYNTLDYNEFVSTVEDTMNEYGWFDQDQWIDGSLTARGKIYSPEDQHAIREFCIQNNIHTY